MPDNYNRNNSNDKNDIDDFFAQFDQPSKVQPRRSANSSRSSRGSSHENPHPRQGQRTVYRDQLTRSSSASSTRSTRSSSQERERTSPRREEPAPSRAGSKRTARGGSGGGGGGRTKIAKPRSKGVNIAKAAGLAVLALCMACGIYVSAILLTAPKIDTDNIYDMLAQRSTMYDSEGKQIENLYLSDGNRTILDYEEIPEDMVNAVVSIEDKKFWKHHGFNYIRLIGAVKDAVFGGGQISGTSTVTQQLARNVYLSDIKSQRSLSRKITEAYYTILIEKNMSKEQIMEAYLNTISLGFNSYGIQAASQAYFSKDAEDLDVLECASLAALPKSPTSYALVRANYDNEVQTSLPIISKSDTVTYMYNGELSSDRRNAVLYNMAEEEYITDQERDEALNDDLKKHIKIGVSADAEESSYFTDFAIDQLTEDIISEYGVSRSDARDMIFTNGLKIYTTMDSRIQDIVEEEFSDDSNYAGISSVRKNSGGDILNEGGGIVLYDYGHYFNDKDEFTLAPDEFRKNSDGSLTILKDKRLNLYDVEVNGEADVSIQFKGMYSQDGGVFYFIESGALSIPQGYTTKDGEGNAVVSAQFFTDYPDFFVKDGDSLVVKDNNYSLKQKIRQPQAGTVIMENETGEIKAMMGGRGVRGKQLFNRTTSPRQPGSSIKPIGSYGPALQKSCEMAKDGNTMELDNSDGSSWGDYVTAGSVINDKPIQVGGKAWPKNWYPGYKGQMTLRHAVQQSVNTCSVKTYMQIGPDYAASMLKKAGVTTVDDEGDVNDLNPAALALGGMTNGISPLEMTAAYAIFPNGGVYKKPIAYTKVLTSHDEVLFEQTAEEERVYDEGVAWIMTDILRSVVSEGLGKRAAIGVQPVGGKTGTTSDSYDLWFCGFTPQYTAAMWMGNDINIELAGRGDNSASFWAKIMKKICADIPAGNFGEPPSNVKKVNGEYYVDGTFSKVSMTRTNDGNSDQGSSSSEETTTAPSSSETTAPSSSETTAPTQTESTESN